MMQSPKNCFWVSKVTGTAAEKLAEVVLQVSGASQVDEVILVSEYFDDDITAAVSMSSANEAIKAALGNMSPITELTKLNPLYLPAGAEEIEKAFVETEDGEGMRFTLMDGNPFTIRLSKLMLSDEPVVEAKLACKPFELPTYNEIIEAHASMQLN